MFCIFLCLFFCFVLHLFITIYSVVPVYAKTFRCNYFARFRSARSPAPTLASSCTLLRFACFAYNAGNTLQITLSLLAAKIYFVLQFNSCCRRFSVFVVYIFYFFFYLLRYFFTFFRFFSINYFEALFFLFTFVAFDLCFEALHFFTISTSVALLLLPLSSYLAILHRQCCMLYLLRLTKTTANLVIFNLFLQV